jgi:hypothetical protein
MGEKDDRDPPIEAQDFVAGPTVVDIGDVRVARGLSRRSTSSCPHRKLIYDVHERRIWCKDCEHDVDAFDAFKSVADGCHHVLDAVARREKAVAEVEAFKIRTIAAKRMDEAWRSRKRVPCCPYCKNGLFPEDFKNRPGMVSREWAKARSTQRVSP